jgi:hypothetical protein
LDLVLADFDLADEVEAVALLLLRIVLLVEFQIVEMGAPDEQVGIVVLAVLGHHARARLLIPQAQRARVIAARARA